MVQPMLALAVAFVAAPAIAYATDGKYYIARKPKRSWQNIEAIQCCICEHSFEPEDMSSCPAYAGPICSLCCSLDARCHDICKPHARIQAQVSEARGKLLPQHLPCLEIVGQARQHRAQLAAFGTDRGQATVERRERAREA